VQCVTLKECIKHVHPHLKSLKIGPDEAISEQIALFLARSAKAGTVCNLTEKSNFFVAFFFLNKLMVCTNWLLFPGIVTPERSHSEMTICPHHREKYGLRWRSGKGRCSVPSDVAEHESPTTKGDRGMNSAESSFISITVGELHPVGSRMG